MSIICKLFGHKPLTHETHKHNAYYASVQHVSCDGLGVWHLYMTADCRRCGETYRIANVHVPKCSAGPLVRAAEATASDLTRIRLQRDMLLDTVKEDREYLVDVVGVAVNKANDARLNLGLNHIDEVRRIDAVIDDIEGPTP